MQDLREKIKAAREQNIAKERQKAAKDATAGQQAAFDAISKQAWQNSGQNSGTQGIQRNDVLKEKYAAAQGKINAQKAKEREQINAYVSLMRATKNFKTINPNGTVKARRAAAQNLSRKASMHKSITPERLVLEAQANAKHAQRLRAVAITHNLAKRLDVELTEKAANDPNVQAAVARAMTYSQQSRLERAETMRAISELSSNYREFGHGGLYGNLASGTFNKELAPTQMTDAELISAIADAENMANSLIFVATFSPTKFGAGGFGSAAQIFQDAADRMTNELKARRKSN